jgi:hypothetical protein
MRLLVLYLRSRQVPLAVGGAVVTVAAVWWIDRAIEHRATDLLALLAVIGATVAGGSGLAGADPHLERTAALAWPPRRTAHVLAIGAAAIGLVAATGLTGDQLGPASQAARNAAGMVGLLALGAATLGAGWAWMVPLTWTVLAQTALLQLWPPPTTGYQQALTWMLQPTASTSAIVTAVIVGVTGTVTYAVLGPRSSPR